MSENVFKKFPHSTSSTVILYYLHLTLILLIENQRVNSDTVLHNLSYDWSNDINTQMTLIIIKKMALYNDIIVYKLKRCEKIRGFISLSHKVGCIWSRLWRGSIVVWCFGQPMLLDQSKCRATLLPHKRAKNETRYIRLYILKVSQKFASSVKNSTKMYIWKWLTWQW